MLIQEQNIFSERVDLLQGLDFPYKMNVFYLLRDKLSENGIKIFEIGEKNEDGVTALHLAVMNFCLGKLMDGDHLSIDAIELIDEELNDKLPHFYDLFIRSVEEVKKSRV